MDKQTSGIFHEQGNIAQFVVQSATQSAHQVNEPAAPLHGKIHGQFRIGLILVRGKSDLLHCIEVLEDIGFH